MENQVKGRIAFLAASYPSYTSNLLSPVLACFRFGFEAHKEQSARQQREPVDRLIRSHNSGACGCESLSPVDNMRLMECLAYSY